MTCEVMIGLPFQKNMAPNSNPIVWIWSTFWCLFWPVGLQTTLLMTMSMNPFPSAFEALRCRHTSGRTYLSPYGNTGYHFVAVGNILSTRVALMCLLAASCGLRFLLEQPSGSFLEDLPRFQWLWGRLKVLFKKKVSLFKLVVEYNHVFTCTCSTIIAFYFVWIRSFLISSSIHCFNIQSMSQYTYHPGRSFQALCTWVSLVLEVLNHTSYIRMMNRSWMRL